MSFRVRSGLLGLAAVAVLLVASRRVQAKGPLAFETHVLKVPGRVLDVTYADVNGDGKEDVIVSHLSGDGDVASERGVPLRFVSVWYQGPPGKPWTEAPQATRNVPDDAVAFAVGGFDPRSKGSEIVFLGASGVTMLGHAPGGKTLAGSIAAISSQQGFFDYPASATLPHWDLAVDLGAGRTDLLVPTKEGYRVFRNDAKEGLVERGLVPLTSSEHFGSQFETKFLSRFLTYTSTMPRVVAIDLDGDKRKDLVVYRNHRLAKFLQRPDGSFPETPDEEKPLPITEDGEKRPAKETTKEGKGGESFASVRLTLKDLNRDGYADLVATKTVGEVGVFESLRTEVLVWMGGKGKTLGEGKPDRILNLKGVAQDPVFVDWKGDGHEDMVVSAYRMDHFTNLVRAITKSVTITTSVFLYKEGEVYSPEPDLVREADVELEALERRGGAEHATFEADLNGDRFRDMVLKASRGKLRIVPGGIEEGFFSGKKLSFLDDDAALLDVPPNADIEVRDIYKDGKGDALVLTNPALDDPERATVRIVEARR